MLSAALVGESGIYVLAAVMGVTDMDPFIMGLTQSAPSLTPLAVASYGILIAASSNDVVKGLYASGFLAKNKRQYNTQLYILFRCLAAGPNLFLLKLLFNLPDDD